MKATIILPTLIATLAMAIQGRAATIGTPNYTSVSDTNPPTYNLTAVGTQDWAVYSGSPITTPYEHKFGGTSITMYAPVTVSPCIFEVLGSATVRSHAAFTWSDGTATGSATAINVYDCGFKYRNTNATVGY